MVHTGYAVGLAGDIIKRINWPLGRILSIFEPLTAFKFSGRNTFSRKMK